MKLKRKSGLTAGIIALSAVAITSVGFASWVISAGDIQTVSGEILVDEVSTSNRTINTIVDGNFTSNPTSSMDNKKGDNSAQKVKFGCSASETASAGKWLSYKRNSGESASDVYENLTIRFYAQMSNVSALNVVNAKVEVIESNSPTGYTFKDSSNNDVKCTVSESEVKGFAAAKNVTLVDLPSSLSLSLLDKDDTDDAALITALNQYATGAVTSGTYAWAKIEFSFRWGALFGVSPVNPYTYYNNHNSSDEITQGEVGGLAALGKMTYAKHAEQFLNALDSYLTGVTYKVTVKTYGDADEKTADTTFGTGSLTVAAA